MMIYYSSGPGPVFLSGDQLGSILKEFISRFSGKRNVLLLPPDYTRYHSLAGRITSLFYEHWAERIKAVLPAIGTHRPMTGEEIKHMFPGIPPTLFKVHNWRTGTTRLGTIPGEYLSRISDGAVDYNWPAEVSTELFSSAYDLVLSIGQVVPHEVVGMANFTKNIFVGIGGPEGINKSHFLGAAVGIENILGKADTPVRRLFDHAAGLYLKDLPLIYILTVITKDERGRSQLRGLFIGDDEECYLQAAELARQLNICHLDKPVAKAVVYLDPAEFKSTWLGNKAIYRTRLAMADDGELIVMAPGVREFGEDGEIDRIIRKYGYVNTPEILALMRTEADLQQNLGAAAHLMHGSTEGRFKVTYAAGGLSREEIEKANYHYRDPGELLAQYDINKLADGYNQLPGGDEIFYISNPATGLWEYSK